VFNRMGLSYLQQHSSMTSSHYSSSSVPVLDERVVVGSFQCPSNGVSTLRSSDLRQSVGRSDMISHEGMYLPSTVSCGNSSHRFLISNFTGVIVYSYHYFVIEL